jgi:hypothetical protein
MATSPMTDAIEKMISWVRTKRVNISAAPTR